MEKAPSIFIKIDEFIFKKLDLLKSEGVFQKFNDGLSMLDEAQQKLVAQLITFGLILLPFVFVAILWWGNSQTKKSLEIKKQIVEQVALFEGNQSTLNNISASYLSPSAIAGRDDLDNKVRNIMSQNAIDQQKVSVTDFQVASTSGAVAKIEATLTFKDFGTSDFSSFMRSMVESERFKILSINMTKIKETNLLQGTMKLMHLGQNAVDPIQE